MFSSSCSSSMKEFEPGVARNPEVRCGQVRQLPAPGHAAQPGRCGWRPGGRDFLMLAFVASRPTQVRHLHEHRAPVHTHPGLPHLQAE